jgi:O-antigen/teichoic acid export membrane protein
MFVGLSVRGIAGALSFAAVFALGGSLTEALALQFVTGLLALGGLDLLFVLRTSRLPARAWWSHFLPPPRRLRFGGSTPGWGGPLALVGTLRGRRDLLFHSSWLGAAGFGGSFIHNVPRYFVEARMGLEAVGYFTALHYVIHAGSMIVISASVMLLYPMSRMIAQNELRRLMMLITGAVLAILVGSIAVWITFFFFGELILGLLYGKDYAAYLNVLLILLMGGCFRFLWLFLSYVLIAWRRFRLHFVLMSLCVAAATISCWLLIDGQNLVGAAFAVIATYLFTTALYLGALLVLGRRPQLASTGVRRAN